MWTYIKPNLPSPPRLTGDPKIDVKTLADSYAQLVGSLQQWFTSLNSNGALANSFTNDGTTLAAVSEVDFYESAGATLAWAQYASSDTLILDCQTGAVGPKFYFSPARNFGIGTSQFGSGNSVLGIVSGTAPSANVIGAQLLYTDPATGALKTRGGAGTVTTLATA